MIPFGVYVFTVLTGAAGLLGHSPLVARLARQALAWLARTALRGSRITRIPERATPRCTRPLPSWAHTEPLDYGEAA